MSGKISGKKIVDVLIHPNTLTLLRIGAAPGIILLLLFPPNRFMAFLAAILFSIAAITDYLDGYIAREWNLITNFGKVMDPIADKLLVCSSLIMMVERNWIPGWVVCVIIAREIGISGLRSMVAHDGTDISASNLGKYKTGFQIAAIIPLLFHFPYFGINLHAIGMFFLWGALALTVWSGVDYVMRFKASLDL